MRQWTVDAFAPAPFMGNPACVVEPFAAWPEDAWMQALAAENNQAETAFLLRTTNPDRFGLRWFTPAVEVNLCGHATLGAAHVLHHELGLEAEALAFETRSGSLLSFRKPTGYELEFPAFPSQSAPAPEILTRILGVAPEAFLVGRFAMAVLASEAEVVALRPDLSLLRSFAPAGAGAGELIVTAAADQEAVDVVSRFFGPGIGIDEDPATGSAHCQIGPYWGERFGRSALNCRQAFPGRGAEIQVEMRKDRVRLRGQVHTIMESRLRL